MISPFTGGPAIPKLELRQRSFRNESFEIWEHFYLCPATGLRFSSPEQDGLNLVQVHNLYRTRHKIPFPDEIRNIREQYGLSAARMSEMLDLGANSYRLYEQGEMPSLANARLIRMMASPENFSRLAEEKRELFSASAWNRLQETLTAQRQPSAMPAIVAYLWNFHLEANEFTGFVKPKLEKVAQFVLYFAQLQQPLKTRLNKLLFLADFLHFKRHGCSISGANYRAIPFGPVPSHYHELFGILQNEGFVSIEEEAYEHGGHGERFKPGKVFDPAAFSPTELACMEEVEAHFRAVRTRDLLDICHEEPAWLDNQEKRNLISYQQYGFRLKAL